MSDAEFELAALSDVTFDALREPGQLVSLTGRFEGGGLGKPPSALTPLLPKPLLPPPLLPPLAPLLEQLKQLPLLLLPPSEPSSPVSPLPPFEPQLAHQMTATSVATRPALAMEPFCSP